MHPQQQVSLPDMGYMKINVHEANLSDDLMGPNDMSHVEIIVSNQSLSQKHNVPLRKVQRSTTGAHGSHPQWNDLIEVRCCLGWDISISIFVEDPKMTLNAHTRFDKIEKNEPRSRNYNGVFQVDNLVAGTCTSGQYYLRKDGKVCGDILLSLEFFPNHQSLKCLTEEMLKEDHLEEDHNSSLLMLLLGELVSMIRQSAKSQHHNPPRSPTHDDVSINGRMDDQSFSGSLYRATMSESERNESKNVWKQIHASAFILKDYLHPSAMQKFLQNHHFAQGALGKENDAMNRSISPETVETFRVAACARSFLVHVLLQPLHQTSAEASAGSQRHATPSLVSSCGSVASSSSQSFLVSSKSIGGHLAPSPTIALIEKQLLLFVQCQDPKASQRGSASLPSQMPLSDVILFIQIISVWYLQHAYIAKTLSDEYSIQLTELSCIRDKFEKFDETLSGDIPSSMLCYLLQDMGEYYSPREVDLLRSLVDVDDLGIVEFPEFIRWWCSN